METGSIISWEKKEGEQLNEGDLLCEIETDKATMGFETPEEGYLAKVILQAGSKDIPVGRLLCIIVSEKEDVEKFKDFKDDGALVGGAEAPPAPAKPAAAPTATKSAPPKPAASFAPPSGGSGGSRPFASPAAKRLAAEKGIDLASIAKGSGMDGMITTSPGIEQKYPSTLIEWYTAPPPNGSVGIRRSILHRA